MVDVFVSVAGSVPVPSGDYEPIGTSSNQLGATEILPTGAPTPWNAGAQQFVCIPGGADRYLVVVRSQWTATWSGVVTLRLVRNGASPFRLLYNGPNNSATSGGTMPGTATVRLEEGDTLQLQARQLSGITRTLNVEEFTISRMRD